MPEQRKFNLPKRAKHTMKDLYAGVDVGNNVIKFAQEKNIFNEIDTTINLYHGVFGKKSSYNMYMREDPDGEDMESNGFVVFEIEFEGDPREFNKKYKIFVKKWLSEIPNDHHDHINFAFHIKR